LTLIEFNGLIFAQQFKLYFMRESLPSYAAAASLGLLLTAQQPVFAQDVSTSRKANDGTPCWAIEAPQLEQMGCPTTEPIALLPQQLTSSSVRERLTPALPHVVPSPSTSTRYWTGADLSREQESACTFLSTNFFPQERDKCMQMVDMATQQPCLDASSWDRQEGLSRKDTFYQCLEATHQDLVLQCMVDLKTRVERAFSLCPDSRSLSIYRADVEM